MKDFVATFIGLTLCLTLLFLSFFSCEKEESPAHVWNIMEVPNSGTIYAFDGDAKSELIISGNSGLYKTINGGDDWTLILNNITAYEMNRNGDTLLAVTLYNESYNDYYSLDNGDSWTLSSASKILEDLRTDQVEDSNGNLYRIERNQSYPKRPDGILKSSDGGISWKDIFPYDRYIYSIYIDDNDKIYVGTIGWDWDGDAFVNLDSKNGIIYYLE